MTARMPGTIPAGILNDQPAASIDFLPTICRLSETEIPTDRVIDVRDITSMLTRAGVPGLNGAIFGMQGEHLATILAGKWKLHVRSPGLPRLNHLLREELDT